MNNVNLWLIGCIPLAIGMAITIIPIIRAFLQRINLNSSGAWFDDATNLGNQQQRLKDHFTRIKGTLIYWKNMAAAHQKLDTARVIWSLISAVSLPVLIQFYDGSDYWAITFMTVLTTWTGFIVALAYTLKSEEKYQGMRQQESDFYDLSRKLLDFPSSNPQELEKQVDEYIERAATIRKVARRVETSSPPTAL